MAKPNNSAKPAKRNVTRPKQSGAPTNIVMSPSVHSFPIVGLGASAGGLEALEQFFANVPPSSGMAFVVIQHLDPTQKGMMPELLQRTTPMEVQQATN